MALDAASIRVMALVIPPSVSASGPFSKTWKLDPAEVSPKWLSIRTGTIVVGQNVKVLPAAVTHGNLTRNDFQGTLKSVSPTHLSGRMTVVTHNRMSR